MPWSWFQVLIEETDQLWKVHCHRDFKEERPEEYESWREMYLRLQDAREQRLRLLTNNIRSAHANKPKGKEAQLSLLSRLLPSAGSQAPQTLESSRPVAMGCDSFWGVQKVFHRGCLEPLENTHKLTLPFITVAKL
jgi:hypothetical protein